MRTTALLVSALALSPATRAPAQTTNDAAAYLAIISSPGGALPPILSSPMLDRALTNLSVAIRYGHLSTGGNDLNSIDGRLVIPASPTVVVGVNAGYQNVSCPRDVCDGHVIGGANVEDRLANLKLGSTVDAARITIGLNAEAGFGLRSGLTAFSLSGGLPVALVSGPPSVRIAPFITPGIGFGRVSGNGDSVNGTRFLLGGGVMFQSIRTGVGASFGFQKAFIQNGETMFGVSLVLGAR
jgi:hypothetical protein